MQHGAASTVSAHPAHQPAPSFLVCRTASRDGVPFGTIRCVYQMINTTKKPADQIIATEKRSPSEWCNEMRTMGLITMHPLLQTGSGHHSACRSWTYRPTGTRPWTPPRQGILGAAIVGSQRTSTDRQRSDSPTRFDDKLKD